MYIHVCVYIYMNTCICCASTVTREGGVRKVMGSAEDLWAVWYIIV